MRLLRDWRLWAGLFVVLMVTLYWVQIAQQFKFDYAEFGRTALADNGYKKEDLHVSAMTINSSPFIGNEATVVFQVGTEKNAKRVTVRMRRPVFGPAIVEAIE